MLRTALSVSVVLLLAACASAPSGTSSHAGRDSRITVSRAYAPPAGFPHFVDHSIGREEISIEAMALVGIPYRWGGNTPDSGFDCSGLVRYVVSRAASVNLPRTTADMSSRGSSIDPGEVAPGDLIFFNTTGRAHSHVGIYVGKLRFVNAPSTGGTVRIDYLTNPYWASRFDGIRRVAAPQDAPAPLDAPVAVPVYAARSAPAPAVDTPRPVRSTVAASVAPVVAATPPATADAYEPPRDYTPATASASPPQTAYSPAPVATAPQHTPDAIDTAADAFEPPPASASAAAQQAQYVQSGNPGGAARNATSDDPIARFAGASN